MSPSLPAPGGAVAGGPRPWTVMLRSAHPRRSPVPGELYEREVLPPRLGPTASLSTVDQGIDDMLHIAVLGAAPDRPISLHRLTCAAMAEAVDSSTMHDQPARSWRPGSGIVVLTADAPVLGFPPDG